MKNLLVFPITKQHDKRSSSSVMNVADVVQPAQELFNVAVLNAMLPADKLIEM
jgi:hypothetical protein